jgi:hypothetical protein
MRRGSQTSSRVWGISRPWTCFMGWYLQRIGRAKECAEVCIGVSCSATIAGVGSMSGVQEARDRRNASACVPASCWLDKRHDPRAARPFAPTERWQSGRSHRTRNAAYGQPYRGFESLPLRHQVRSRVAKSCRSTRSPENRRELAEVGDDFRSGRAQNRYFFDGCGPDSRPLI